MFSEFKAINHLSLSGRNLHQTTVSANSTQTSEITTKINWVIRMEYGSLSVSFALTWQNTFCMNVRCLFNKDSAYFEGFLRILSPRSS